MKVFCLEKQGWTMFGGGQIVNKGFLTKKETSKLYGSTNNIWVQKKTNSKKQKKMNMDAELYKLEMELRFSGKNRQYLLYQLQQIEDLIQKRHHTTKHQQRKNQQLYCIVSHHIERSKKIESSWQSSLVFLEKRNERGYHGSQEKNAKQGTNDRQTNQSSTTNVSRSVNQVFPGRQRSCMNKMII